MKAVQSLASLRQKVCHFVFRPNKCQTELNFIFLLKIKVSAISIYFLCQLFFSLFSMGTKMFQKLTKNQQLFLGKRNRLNLTKVNFIRKKISKKESKSHALHLEQHLNRHRFISQNKIANSTQIFIAIGLHLPQAKADKILIQKE